MKSKKRTRPISANRRVLVKIQCFDGHRRNVGADTVTGGVNDLDHLVEVAVRVEAAIRAAFVHVVEVQCVYELLVDFRGDGVGSSPLASDDEGLSVLEEGVVVERVGKGDAVVRTDAGVFDEPALVYANEVIVEPLQVGILQLVLAARGRCGSGHAAERRRRSRDWRSGSAG